MVQLERLNLHHLRLLPEIHELLPESCNTIIGKFERVSIFFGRSVSNFFDLNTISHREVKIRALISALKGVFTLN